MIELPTRNYIRNAYRHSCIGLVALMEGKMVDVINISEGGMKVERRFKLSTSHHFSPTKSVTPILNHTIWLELTHLSMIRLKIIP